VDTYPLLYDGILSKVRYDMHIVPYINMYSLVSYFKITSQLALITLDSLNVTPSFRVLLYYMIYFKNLLYLSLPVLIPNYNSSFLSAWTSGSHSYRQRLLPSPYIISIDLRISTIISLPCLPPNFKFPIIRSKDSIMSVVSTSMPILNYKLKVVDILDNTTTYYISQSAASRALNISASTISRFISQNRTKPSKGRYIFSEIS
jgi:hypothetical protein